MSINPIGAANNPAIALERILQMASEQSLNLAEKLVKVNAQSIIDETQLGTIGQVIDILV